MKKQNLKDRKCYMCDATASSREHVPPACLFPEQKDIRTDRFRKNLITVPSCSEHNSKKSNDDEFLMTALSGIVGNNAIAFIHLLTKVRRAVERKTHDFMDAVIKDRVSLNINSDTGKRIPVFIGRADLPRLHSCFNHIAHGVYYHKFDKRFTGKVHILIDFVTYESEQSETYKLLCRKRFEMEPQKLQHEGNTPEIFRYEVFEPDEIGMIAMRMTFYNHASVFVAFQPETTNDPQDLISQMIKSGIPVTVHFADGSEFQLNKPQ